MMPANKDFEELFASLNARSVRAVIVGAHAFAFHAKPRYTKDIDIFIDATPENVERLLLALGDFGFAGLGLSAPDFALGRGVQLGVEPNRVDILTAIEGVTFDEAWAGRVPGKFGAQNVFYLGRSQLITNKRACGRGRDLDDLEILES